MRSSWPLPVGGMGWSGTCPSFWRWSVFPVSGRDTFEVIVLGEDCARPKPHPDPYQKALEVLGLQPHEAIVIEDSPFGAAAWTTSLLRHVCDNMLSI